MCHFLTVQYSKGPEHNKLTKGDKKKEENGRNSYYAQRTIELKMAVSFGANSWYTLLYLTFRDEKFCLSVTLFISHHLTFPANEPWNVITITAGTAKWKSIQRWELVELWLANDCNMLGEQDMQIWMGHHLESSPSSGEKKQFIILSSALGMEIQAVRGQTCCAAPRLVWVGGSGYVSPWEAEGPQGYRSGAASEEHGTLLAMRTALVNRAIR